MLVMFLYIAGSDVTDYVHHYTKFVSTVCMSLSKAPLSVLLSVHLFFKEVYTLVLRLAAIL